MTQNALQPITPPVERSRKPPVRVKVQRQPPKYGRMYPPDGERKQWWNALKNALGTSSSSFVNVSLLQLQAAARLPDGQRADLEPFITKLPKLTAELQNLVRQRKVVDSNPSTESQLPN